MGGVYLRLQRLSDNAFWSGPVLKWTASISSVAVNNVYASSWSLTDSNLPTSNDLTDGTSYYVSSVGLDSADDGGNQEAYYSVRGSTFIFNSKSPTSSIALPLDAKFYSVMPSINGAAFAAYGNVLLSTVSLSISNTKLPGPNNCYAPNGGFTASCPAWFKAFGANNPWNFDFNNSSLFSHASSYVVLSSATDMAGNTQVALSSAGFTFDTLRPTATLTTPQWINASVTSFVGTSTDALSGIGSLQIAVSSANGASNSWWDGSSFSGAGAVYFDTTTYNVGALNDAWTWNRPPLTHGTVYLVRTNTTDRAGNNWILDQAASVTFDTAPPTAIISAPVNGGFYNNLATITGTSADNIGVSTIALIIQDVTQAAPNCYSDVAGAFTAACPYPFPARGTAGAWNFGGVTWSDGHRYIVTAQATDKAGNVQAVFGAGISSNSFIFDQRSPTSLALNPDGSQAFADLPMISGTASGVSLLTPLAGVQLSLGQITGSTTDYFDGALFNATTEYFNQTMFVGAASGTWSFATPVLTTGKYYIIRSKAVDAGGNEENFVVSISTQFLFDKTKSTGAVTALAGSASNAPYHRTIAPITGSAFDGPSAASAGLETLAGGGAQIRILDDGLGLWWNNTGGDFNQPLANSAWFNANSGSAASWTYDHAALDGKLVSGNSYRVQFRAKDRALPANYNQGPSSNGIDSNFTLGTDSITFIADTAPPLSRVTTPGDGAVIKTLTTIGGTAVDQLVNNSSSGISSAGLIEFSVQEISPNTSFLTCPAYSTFTSTTESWCAATSLIGSVWSRPAPPLLPSRGGY